MKAWVHYETGGPETLKLEDQPLPKPQQGELLVRNHAIGLNPVDWKFILWGHPVWSWPHIPGVDGTGEVVGIGPGVSHIASGTRVAYHNDLLRQGSFAEYTVIPARAAIPLPASIPYAVAATIPCPVLTAIQAVEKVPLEPGANVLVTGASGAVGGALVQLARRRGWITHAVCSKAEASRVLRLGAASTTDYRQPGWKEMWADRIKSQSLQAIFDMVSGSHAASLVSLLEANGHLVCIQDRQETAPLAAFTTTVSLHEVGLNALHGYGTDRQWGQLVGKGARAAEEISKGEFDPQVIEVAPFAELPHALERLKTGPNPGNRVVSLDI